MAYQAPIQPGHPAYAAARGPLPQGYTHAATDGYVQLSHPALDDQRNAATSPPSDHHRSRHHHHHRSYEPSRSHPLGFVQKPGVAHHDSSPDPDSGPEYDEATRAEMEVEWDRWKAEVDSRAREQENTVAMLAVKELQSQETLRHGFHEVNNSEEYMAHLSKNYYLYWTEDRFKRKEKDAEPIEYWHQPPKARTVSAAIFLCLRFGFDPPDVSKTDPCARLEAWTDPWSLPREKALDTIGKKVTEQYEGLAPAYHKMKFKMACDVPVEEFKKAIFWIRKQARHERALIHYNGHGVPRPTPSGEIWVFNKAYTQYIPISVYDLLGWVGAPTVFVWDCHNAGNVLTKVVQFAAQRDAEADDAAAASQGQGGAEPQTPSATGPEWGNASKASSSVPPHSGPRFADTIQLAACSATQSLPSDPLLPADVFTSCLTSPIEMAMRFYVIQNSALKERLASTAPFAKDLDKLHAIPGRMEMRRTPLGELMWIFTSVTDAIAWNCLPRDLFARIFRGDLVLAAIFRGFLLAERVLRAYSCTPMSVPALPETHRNELWKAWDLALDMCLSQLQGIWKSEQDRALYDAGRWPRGQAPPKVVVYQFSTFFSEQLTAFEVWLDEVARSRPDKGRAAAGSARKGGERPRGEKFPPAPPQLPIVLQVLLSQAHRLRALILLCRFMDMGPWAVHLSLSIGIFQYVLKLLQAPAPELKPVLIFIWARILTVYPDGRYDLFRHNMTRQNTPGEAPIEYFTRVLAPEQDLPIPNVEDHKAMCCFILSVACRTYFTGQMRLLQLDVLRSCAVHLDTSNHDMLRQWTCLLLGHLWDRCDQVKGSAIASSLQLKLCALLMDKSPEVRTAAAYALGTLVGTSSAPVPSNPTHESPHTPTTAAAAASSAGGQPGSIAGSDDAPRAQPLASLSAADPDKTSIPSSQLMATELAIAMACVNVAPDGSASVRRELVVVLSAVVAAHLGHFVVAAYDVVARRKDGRSGPAARDREREATMGGQRGAFVKTDATTAQKPAVAAAAMIGKEKEREREGEEMGGVDPEVLSVEFATIYTVLLDLSLDPFQEVAEVACLVVDYIHSQLLETPLGTECASLIDHALEAAAEEKSRDRSDATAAAAQQQKRGDVGTRGERPYVNGTGERGLTSSASMGNLALLKNKGLVHAVRSLGAHLGSSPNLTALASSASSSATRPIPSATPAPKVNGFATPSMVGSPESYAPVSLPSQRLRKRDLPAPSAPLSVRAVQQHRDPPSAAEVSSVIARLRDADRIRLRRHLRHASSSAGGQTPSSSAPGSPSESESFFNDDDNMSPLPLRSDFYDWSARYYLEPQMDHSGEDQEGGQGYYSALWRKHRNESVILATQPLKEDAVSCRWDMQVASMTNPAAPTAIVLHQFEDHLIAADERGYLSVYDWSRQRRVNTFSNQSPPRTRITTLKLVNEDDEGLLLTGSSDGTVRLFRHYDSEDVEVVTAFRGLPSIEPSSKAEAGLIAEWQQGTGQLLIGGNTREIRVWDAYREALHYSILTRANSCISSLTSDQVAGFIVAAGFGDGSVRLYDQRKPAREAMIRVFRGHHPAWIQTIHMQRGGQRELLSGDLMGEICQWDIRQEQPLWKGTAHQEGMAVMAVHEHAPVYATGSLNNIIKVWPIGADDCTSKFRASPAMSSSNAPRPVDAFKAMSFHPHRMILATGSSELNNISLYQCDSRRPALATY